MEVSKQLEITMNRANKAEIEVEHVLQRVERLSSILRTVCELCDILKNITVDGSASDQLLLITRYIRTNLPANSDESDIPF